MRRIDFISKAPNFSIFKEGANKTNLGGFLYMVYIIIILLLAIVYFYDYFTNEKYQFNYTLVKANKDEDLDENDEMSSILNADINYMLWLGKDDADPYKNISDNKNFLIVDIKKMYNNQVIGNEDKCIIKQGEPFKYNVRHLEFGVLYRCDGSNCTIREDDKITITSYYLFFAYQGYSIEHQNSEKPIQPITGDNYWLNKVQFLNNTNIVYLNWEVIEYEEEKGVFGKTFNKVMGNKNNNKYYAGDYKTKETFTDDGHMKILPQTLCKVKDPDGNSFILLLYLKSIPVDYEYERYSRKKVSVLDILANIASLSSTALNLMGLVYGILYAENYNNFKIIENILTKKMKVNINKDTKNEGDLEKVKIELKGDIIEKNLIEKSINDQDSDDIIEDEGEKMKSSSLNLTIPRFIDFLFHKFYSKCCGYSSRHILINSCNDIVAKYTTIENILYNQMRLECLWKDYKWNNPQFQKMDKDDLILNLKEK